MLGMSLIFLAAVAGNLMFLRLNPNLDLFVAPRLAPLSVEEIVDERVRALQDQVRDERLYADHDLRIAGLAARLQIPEHKLRQMINEELGFRNFNQFINAFRIEEASERILNDTQLPILSIALDVGFRSLSSFNSSF